MVKFPPSETQKKGGRKPSLFLFTLLLFAACACVIFGIQSSTAREHDERQLRLAIPASMVSPHGFGFNMTAADLFWLRLLQDINYKESKEVRLGVVYRMLDVMTTLDRRFHAAYSAGLSALSVLVSDAEGARLLYDRAVENYPDDWHILFAAGYHNLYEVGDCKRAAELYARAAQKGAPYWVGFLAEKLYTRTGQFALAKAALEDAVQHFQDEKSKRQIREKMEDLEKNRNAASDGDKSPLVKCQKRGS